MDYLTPTRWNVRVGNLLRRGPQDLCPVRVEPGGVQLLRQDLTYSAVHPLPYQARVVIAELAKRHPARVSGPDLKRATEVDNPSSAIRHALSEVRELEDYIIRPGKPGAPRRAGYGLKTP